MELSGEVLTERFTHLLFVVAIEEHVAFHGTIPQALVYMSAAAGKIFGDLGHECCHDAMTVGDLFHGGLE